MDGVLILLVLFFPSKICGRLFENYVELFFVFHRHILSLVDVINIHWMFLPNYRISVKIITLKMYDV